MHLVRFFIKVSGDEYEGGYLERIGLKHIERAIEPSGGNMANHN